MPVTANAASEPAILTLLNQIRPALSPALLDEEGYKRIASVSSLLPLELSSYCGFECRLRQEEAYSDILFSIQRDMTGSAFLSGKKPSYIDCLCATWPVWQTLRIFANGWLNPGNVFHSHLGVIWLEFDIIDSNTADSLRNAIAQPNLFFGLTPESLTQDIVTVTEKLMQIFGRTIPSPDILQRFLGVMPRGARVWMLALMLTRETEPGLRLCVQNVAPNDIKPWLASILPLNESEALASILGQVLPMTARISYAFNLTQLGVEPKIGLECSIDWPDNPDQTPPLVLYLTDHGLCLPAKAAAMLNYSHITASQIKKHLDEENRYIHTSRRINHIKLVLEQNKVLQAKVYLAVSRLPLADALQESTY